MKPWFLVMLMVAVAAAFAPDVAEAKRFGGGSSKGLQRSTPQQTTPQTPPPQTPAQPAPAPQNAALPAAGTAAAAAGTAAKRSWLGPVAGLAAGLGLAALASHLGLGEELMSLMLIVLLALVGVAVVRLLMRRGAPAAQPALAGAGAPVRVDMPVQRVAPTTPTTSSTPATPQAFTGLQIGAGVRNAQLPADFDRAGFERIAKMIFIRMQAAHDAADLDDLRQFTTPELFADVRLDLQERGAAAQHTDVLAIEAAVQDYAEEDGRQIVSVRYTGQVREEQGAEPVTVDESWHLVRPADGSRNWAIAGIQQAA